MTAPAPRPDGRPRLHVYKVSNEWRVSVGHNPLTLHSESNQRAAFTWAESRIPAPTPETPGS